MVKTKITSIVSIQKKMAPVLYFDYFTWENASNAYTGFYSLNIEKPYYSCSSCYSKNTLLEVPKLSKI